MNYQVITQAPYFSISISSNGEWELHMKTEAGFQIDTVVKR